MAFIGVSAPKSSIHLSSHLPTLNLALIGADTIFAAHMLLKASLSHTKSGAGVEDKGPPYLPVVVFSLVEP